MKKKDYEITVKRVSVVGFNVEAENIQKARELAEKDAKNHDWASEDAEYIVDNNDAPEFLKRIDFTTLRGQKTVLIKLADAIRDTPPQPYKKDGVDMTVIMMPKETEDVLEGILGLIDALQDYAVDVLGVPEMHVFDFELEEEREKETDEEKFARESAARLFDELCESDGFHDDDEMSEEFIASIMASDMHAAMIKAKLRAQILDDMMNNCPQEFTYSKDGYVYDNDMREDYEGLVTAYIREQFNEGKTKDLYLCPHCGSDNVESKSWVNPNTNEVKDSDTGDDDYCNDCEQHGELLYQSIPINKKVVGFQVVGDEGHENEGDIHPQMDGSFCLYSLPQAKAMLDDDDTMYKGEWKLLTIWSDDVEEPTFMFEGDPRNPTKMFPSTNTIG